MLTDRQFAFDQSRQYSHLASHFDGHGRHFFAGVVNPSASSTSGVELDLYLDGKLLSKGYSLGDLSDVSALAFVPANPGFEKPCLCCVVLGFANGGVSLLHWVPHPDKSSSHEPLEPVCRMSFCAKVHCPIVGVQFTDVGGGSSSSSSGISSLRNGFVHGPGRGFLWLTIGPTSESGPPRGIKENVGGGSTSLSSTNSTSASTGVHLPPSYGSGLPAAGAGPAPPPPPPDGSGRVVVPPRESFESTISRDGSATATTRQRSSVASTDSDGEPVTRDPNHYLGAIPFACVKQAVDGTFPHPPYAAFRLDLLKFPERTHLRIFEVKVFRPPVVRESSLFGLLSEERERKRQDEQFVGRQQMQFGAQRPDLSPASGAVAGSSAEVPPLLLGGGLGASGVGGGVEQFYGQPPMPFGPEAPARAHHVLVVGEDPFLALYDNLRRATDKSQEVGSVSSVVESAVG